MIAGIAANNASGMCCGNVHHTYHTMLSVRIAFTDGSVLDTASPQSRQGLLAEHGELIRKIDSLARRVKQSTTLCRRIRHKYRIKNTTGYSLQALALNPNSGTTTRRRLSTRQSLWVDSHMAGCISEIRAHGPPGTAERVPPQALNIRGSRLPGSLLDSEALQRPPYRYRIFQFPLTEMGHKRLNLASC